MDVCSIFWTSIKRIKPLGLSYRNLGKEKSSSTLSLLHPAVQQNILRSACALSGGVSCKETVV
ncbi:hypothetical protein ACFPFV_11410 [Salinicoccus siamensis]|uniref:hypothetical protein n=1 Tax=Salinicoccus siamensis TaxID=381830 RepID=UPI003620BD3B